MKHESEVPRFQCDALTVPSATSPRRHRARGRQRRCREPRGDGRTWVPSTGKPSAALRDRAGADVAAVRSLRRFGKLSASASAGSAQAGLLSGALRELTFLAATVDAAHSRGGQGTVPTLPALRPGGHRRTPWAERYFDSRGVGAPRRSCKNASRPTHVRERPGALAGASPPGAIVARLEVPSTGKPSVALRDRCEVPSTLRQAQRERFWQAQRERVGRPGAGASTSSAQPGKSSAALRDRRRPASGGEAFAQPLAVCAPIAEAVVEA